MADIKGQIEELAAHARVGAHGQKMACGCSTCQEVVDAAEKIMLQFFEEKCETFALAVGIVLYSRLGLLYEETLGEDRYNYIEEKIISRCESIGMGPTALIERMFESRRTRIKPKAGPV